MRYNRLLQGTYYNRLFSDARIYFMSYAAKKKLDNMFETDTLIEMFCIGNNFSCASVDTMFIFKPMFRL